MGNYSLGIACCYNPGQFSAKVGPEPRSFPIGEIGKWVQLKLGAIIGFLDTVSFVPFLVSCIGLSTAFLKLWAKTPALLACLEWPPKVELKLKGKAGFFEGSSAQPL